MNATITKRRGAKADNSAGQIPAPNQSETLEAYQTRCAGLGHKDTAAIDTAWKAANPTKATPPPAAEGTVSMDALMAAIGSQLETTMKAQLPEHLKSQVTTEAIQKVVAAEIAKLNQTDSKALSTEQINALVDASAKAAFDSIRRDKKSVFDPADANRGGRVEIPFSLSKGNLPPHMKQLANVLLRRDIDHEISDSMRELCKSKSDEFWVSLQSQGVKALTSSGSGTGAEWVPRDLTSELYRRLYLESQIAQAWLTGEVQMPTNPYDYPLLTTDPVFTLNNVENTDATATDLGTSSFTLTAQRLMALCQFSYEAMEESIIPLLPTIQTTLARAAARALEDAIINGDTTSTHQDTGSTVATNDAKRAWKGLRKLAIAGSLQVSFASGGVSRANLLSLVATLGKWGVRTQDLLWIVGTKGWTTLLGLDEVALAYARGMASTYTQGGPTPAPWGGMIAVSEQVAENLNASGVWDNSTTTKGQIILVNKAGFVMGSRREFTVEVFRNIRSQTHDVVASFRKAFQPVETPSSTIKTVAQAYNYTA
jgi:HK97 family phage major capsid protein